MYAIRSYYVTASTPALAISIIDENTGFELSMSSFSRITSYNVCYTKLLRGVLAVTILFFDISSPIYAVYAVSTGAAAMICYVVWKYIGINKFEDGFLYGIVISVVFATLASAAAFFAFGREPFSIQLISMVKECRITSYNVCYTKLLRVLLRR